MDLIAGMQPTGRRVQGPGFELAGLDGDRGAHTAILVGSTPRTGAELAVRDGVRAFLERPGFAGLARLVAVDRGAGAAVFATGEVWSAAEVLASLRRRGRVAGLRAGLELAWQAAELLARAHKEASPLGAPCHGAVDPWRLALRRDGQVVLLGYDVVAGRHALATEGPALAEALRYAPPERLAGRDEDATSDLFSLALVALEWIVGEPVYAGSVDQIRESALEADGDRVMWAWRERLPKSVAAVLGRAIRRDVDARWPDAASFAAALRQELGAPNLDGPSLHALLASKDIDSPTRFVALEEERGDADARGAGVADEAPPDRQARKEVRARIVSLGGRLGRAARAERPPAPTDVPVPQPAAQRPADEPVGAPPVAETPTPPSSAEAVDVEAPAPASVAAPKASEAAPPPEDAGEEVDDTSPDALAELLDAPDRAAPQSAPPDEVPTVELKRADPTTATVWSPAGPTTLTARTPDGPDATVTVAPELAATQVALVMAAAAGLSRLDANGRVVAIWRLTRADGAVPDQSKAASLVDDVLSLTRADARLVPVRVRVGARVVEANVSTALLAVEAAAALAGVGGLPTGRSLLVDGAAVSADALLDGLVRSGSTVEIVP